MAEQPDVGTEVVAQENSQDPQEEAQNQEASQAQQKNDAERNWQKTREVLEAQKRELELERQRAKRYEDELVALKRQAAPAPEPDELDSLAADDILTVSQAEKIAERKFKKLLEQAEDSKGEDVARSSYSDYDAIVTQANLERLKSENPRAFAEIAKHPSLYGKADYAYKTLKLMVGSAEASENRDRLEKNSVKPRSSSSLGATGALTQASRFENGLTPDLKKALRQEMIQASKKA